MIKSGESTSGESCLSEKSDIFCAMGNSALVDMVTKIFSGSICLQEMKIVYQKMTQVEKLCLAGGQWDLNDVMSTLELRNSECCAFKRHKESLGSFCRELEAHRLQIEGIFKSKGPRGDDTRPHCNRSSLSFSLSQENSCLGLYSHPPFCMNH